MRRLGEPHDRLGGEGGFVAQSKPVVAGPCVIGIGEIGLAAVADVEKITECLDGMALNSFAQQGRDGKVEMLAEQIQQRRFNRRDGVNRDAQIEGLLAAPA